jgi:hypothetical protein
VKENWEKLFFVVKNTREIKAGSQEGHGDGDVCSDGDKVRECGRQTLPHIRGNTKVTVFLQWILKAFAVSSRILR